MPSNPRKNKGVYLELPPELVEEMKTFATGRGQAFKDAVAEAMRRHLAYPPPPPAPEPPPAPLPPVTPSPVAVGPAKDVQAGKAKPRKGKK